MSGFFLIETNQGKDDKVGRLSISPMRNRIGCWSTIGGAILLCGLCYYIMFYSPKDGSPGRLGVDYVDMLGREGIECMVEVHERNITALTDKVFARKCFTNPFFLWSIFVFISVVLSSLCLI